MFRCVVNRVSRAEVIIAGSSQGRIQQGLLVLFGVGQAAQSGLLQDNLRGLGKLTDKICGLRIFSDSNGKMNLSVRDIQGGIYIVSQFTLFADCTKGLRPSFTAAAAPAQALFLYEEFLRMVKLRMDELPVYSGEFGANMQLDFRNDGPVTLILDANAEGVQ